MSGDAMAVGTILALGLVCFLARAAGFWAAGIMPLPGWLLRLLKHLPGTLLAAMVAASALASGGLAGPCGAVVGALAMTATRNALLSAFAGAGAAALVVAAGA
ncbi:AzlD domain-containing protein [Arenibaculum pallidiluteum]|uniref:AzlD domain-containing protein n=1 Tax=Arenibaculum pallidiluteum TaxID=2812559 RepID=UPI001A95A644|nr:AzlD domain-containing protein [Arenibaculum pallidiluteum]